MLWGRPGTLNRFAAVERACGWCEGQGGLGMGQESRRSLQSRGTGTPLLVLPTVFIRDLGSDLQHHCSELGRVDRLSPPHLVLPLGFSPRAFVRNLFRAGSCFTSGVCGLWSAGPGWQPLSPRGLPRVDGRGRGPPQPSWWAGRDLRHAG